MTFNNIKEFILCKNIIDFLIGENVKLVLNISIEEYKAKLSSLTTYYNNIKTVRNIERVNTLDELLLEIEIRQHMGKLQLHLDNSYSNINEIKFDSEQDKKLNSYFFTNESYESCEKLIKEYDFELGLQMMTGLYGDSDEGAIETAEKLISLMPDTVRIYPTVVLENTELEKLYKSRAYTPQTTEDAVKICSRLLMMFHEKNIRVIRLGLHSGGNVEEGFVAGAYHPAFRELCESRIYLDRVMDEIKNFLDTKYADILNKYKDNKNARLLLAQEIIDASEDMQVDFKSFSLIVILFIKSFFN